MSAAKLSMDTSKGGHRQTRRSAVYGGELRWICFRFHATSTFGLRREATPDKRRQKSTRWDPRRCWSLCCKRSAPTVRDLARPGEFTLRAFLAGRLDLTQAEAVLGTIEANDDRALRTALDQLAGGLSSPLQQLRGDLLDLLADLEAGLDFVGEDIQFVSRDQVIARLSFAAGVVDRIKEQIGGRSASQPERHVVLVGWPNAGKSTLFNALVGREAAIASPQAGTTRDYLQTELETSTGKCLLIDTAGFESLRVSEEIDSVAQQLSDRQRAIGDIVVLCLDSSRPINAWEQQQLTVREGDIVVWTKCEQPRNGLLRLFRRSRQARSRGAAWMSSVA